jgi:hypothetical protein
VSKTLLQLKSKFHEYQNGLWTGTATSGSTAFLADASLKNPVGTDSFPFPIEGKYIYITAGGAANDVRRVVRYDPALGRMEPNTVFSTAVTTASTYEIWGNAVHPTDLTRLFNYVLTYCRPVVETKLTPTVSAQEWYDITNLISNEKDVLRVFVHTVDGSYQRPFTKTWLGSDGFRVHQLPTAVRTVAISGSPAGGTYHLHYNSTAVTSALAYNAASSVFQTSMQTLLGSTRATVATTGTTPNFTHSLTFSGTPSPTPWDLVADATALTGGSSPAVTVAEGTGLQGFYLEISPAVAHEHLTAGSTNMAQRELWLEHKKTLAAFTADTDTVEDLYAEWLSHEAIFSHALRQGTLAGGDAARWRALAEAEKHHVLRYRALYMPARPHLIRHERPQNG